MSKFIVALVTTLLLCATSASAQARALSERAVALETVSANPTVRAAVSDVRQSAEALRAERARYRPNLLVDVSGSEDNTQAINLPSGTREQRSEALSLGAELNQRFSFGTQVALRLDNFNTRFQGPLYMGSTDAFTVGPAHLFGARLTVTQPLLRGFGDDVGLADLRAAWLDRRERERARDAAASKALSVALQTYWELWYAQNALTIEREARDLAQKLRDETQRKVSAGSMADVELLTYETRLAQLDQSVLDAEVEVATRSVELRRALGMQDEIALDATEVEAPAIEHNEAGPTLSAAEEFSVTIAIQRLALERAQTVLRSATDATRARLDVSAWVQASGLGNKSAIDALSHLRRLDYVSGNVSVTFELPLSSERHAAQLASARQAVTGARQRLRASVQQVRADTARELTLLSQAQTKITLAERTADVSRRSADAQQKRFASGSAIALEVREAEDAVRRARLSIERNRVDAVKAQIRLAELTGSLLARWVVNADPTL